MEDVLREEILKGTGGIPWSTYVTPVSAVEMREWSEIETEWVKWAEEDSRKLRRCEWVCYSVVVVSIGVAALLAWLVV